jgi:hypothetical protein
VTLLKSIKVKFMFANWLKILVGMIHKSWHNKKNPFQVFFWLFSLKFKIFFFGKRIFEHITSPRNSSHFKNRFVWNVYCSGRMMCLFIIKSSSGQALRVVNLWKNVPTIFNSNHSRDFSATSDMKYYESFT